VIVDSPPILGLADALLIGNMVKNIIVVVEAGETSRKAVIGCMKRLMAANVRPLGCILNRFHPRHIGYGYDYHYAYYYYSDGYKKKMRKRAKREAK
jgi:Mrp family chromosome partitioning ATPase